MHGTGKTVFDGVSSDQLHDGIGTKPSFRQLPRGSGKAEIIGGKPDLIPDGVNRGIRAMPICLVKDVGMRLDQVVVGA